jgi:hypothetical protein
MLCSFRLQSVSFYLILAPDVQCYLLSKDVRDLEKLKLSFSAIRLSALFVTK